MSLTETGAPFHGYNQPAIGADGWEAWMRPSWIYVIASGRDDRPVKIGYAADIDQRIRAFEAGNPYGLRAAHRFATFTGVARQVERRVHKVFAAQALGREWFDIDTSAAAAEIPGHCERGESALHAYRDAILSDSARLADADGVAALERHRRAVWTKALAMSQASRVRPRARA